MVPKPLESARCPQCGILVIAESDARIKLRPAIQHKLHEAHQLLGRIKCNRCKGQIHIHYERETS